MSAMVEEKIIDGVSVVVEYAGESDQRVSDEEVRAYLARGAEKYPNGHLEWLKLEVDGEDVGIHYGLEPMPFDRTRITGYLVGTMDRWNDAKSAGEADRVKHGVPASCSCCS